MGRHECILGGLEVACKFFGSEFGWISDFGVFEGS